MNEERIFTLMMDALEGVLDEAESAELNAYLADQPQLAQEWESMQAVDSLLLATPPTVLPVNFAERTLSRLPNERNRRIFMSAFYVLLLLGGLLPIIGFLLFSSQLDMAAVSGGSFADGLQLIRVIGSGMASALRTFVVSQPLILGWVTLMLGAIFMWATVYKQFASQVQPVLVRTHR